MLRVCVPTTNEELEEKVRIGEPVLVETVTYAGVVPLSCNVTVVKPQIEDVLDEPFNLLKESFKKGYVKVFDPPR